MERGPRYLCRQGASKTMNSYVETNSLKGDSMDR